MTGGLKACVLALAATTVAASVAHATGFERGTADTDILFEEGNFNMRAGVTYVNPTRKYAVVGPDNLNAPGTNYSDAYAVPSFAAKINVHDDLRCAATLTETFGASASTPLPSGPSGKLTESFSATEMGATCAYFASMGPGNVFVLGGVYYEIFDYDLVAGGGLVTVSLSDGGFGWRAGVGYEIPEIAFRAQVLYRSGLSVRATGSGSGPIVSSATATGSAETPQSVELRAQSGIAPGWLALGSIKWTDWSVNEQLTLSTAAIPVTGGSENNYFWRDGWTFTGGIGRQFSEQISAAGTVTYRTDVNTGFDLAFSSWTLGGIINANGEFGQLSLGGGVSFLGSATDEFGDSVGNDTSYAVTARYAVNW